MFSVKGDFWLFSWLFRWELEAKVYPVGKFFAHPRDDPVTFVVST